MQRRAQFGRRAAPQIHHTPAVVRTAPPAEVRQLVPPEEAPSTVDDVERELAEWKAMRKLRKRSFREPWRSVSIAALLGFGASTWLLPDSVADIAQFVTLGLSAAAFFAGFRKAPGAGPAGSPQLPRL
jgi:hypothetical protein